MWKWNAKNAAGIVYFREICNNLVKFKGSSGLRCFIYWCNMRKGKPVNRPDSAGPPLSRAVATVYWIVHRSPPHLPNKIKVKIRQQLWHILHNSSSMLHRVFTRVFSVSLCGRFVWHTIRYLGKVITTSSVRSPQKVKYPSSVVVWIFILRTWQLLFYSSDYEERPEEEIFTQTASHHWWTIRFWGDLFREK